MIHWLASYPKSGSTWARLLLTAYHRDGYVDINDAIIAGDVNDRWYQAASVLCLRDMSIKETSLIRNAALLNLIGSVRYRPLVVKTHFANIELFDVRMIPPQMSSRSIYIARDPRDIVPSFARHLGKGIDETIDVMDSEMHRIGEDGKVSHVLSSWSNHVRSWGSGDPEVLLVRYEDMKADPCDALDKMLTQVGVKTEPDRVQRAVEACELHRLKEQEKNAGFVEASRKAGDFFGATKDCLTPEQRLKVENAHEQMMTEIGY